MNKHTPGPWQIADGESRRVYLINHGRDAVGETVYTETRNPADARLIAAAPDLLEALLMAKKAISRFDNGHAFDAHGIDSEAQRQVDAAIAKATGEQT